MKGNPPSKLRPLRAGRLRQSPALEGAVTGRTRSGASERCWRRLSARLWEGRFFLLGTARGRKALHRRGEVLEGMIGRRGAVGRTGVAWLDEAGTDHVAVRFSQSLGLPAPRPDILGMALRIAAQPGQFGDVLLATTGTGLLGRYVLLPTRRYGDRPAYRRRNVAAAAFGRVADAPHQIDLELALGRWSADLDLK